MPPYPPPPSGVLGFPVVGLGASSGGLEAYRNFLSCLPPDTGMAFILVQHLEPSHPSLMAELLAVATAMPVQQATKGMLIEPDHLYVIPPGTYLTTANGALHLTPTQTQQGARLPFDRLLKSLSAEYGPRSAAVVLSGTGTDGSAGLLSIQQHGGLIIAQDPKDADFSGMPESAIATGLVDLVLPVADIPAALSHHFLHPTSSSGSAPQTTDILPDIITLLRQHTPHDFQYYKPGTLQRRIERRAALAQFKPHEMAHYLETLRTEPGECAILARDLLINVTSFFRDPKIYTFLSKKVIPEMLAHHPAGHPLRLWVAGCSSGEETYSLAMLLLEQLGRGHPAVKLQIFASDADSEAVAVAREGHYPLAIHTEVSEERLARFFTQEEKGYRVRPEMRETILFTVQDVLTDPPFSRIDLLSCRNLLIYLTPAAQEKVISHFHFSLRPGGILWLGNAESIGRANTQFDVVAKTERIYRRAVASSEGVLSVTATPRHPQHRIATAPDTTRQNPPPPIPPQDLSRLAQLEAELESLRHDLKNTLRQLEVSSLEQKIIDEEALSVNEEFQSTNEELITSKEELQSLNEELTALNNQLQDSLERQRTTSDDLQNVLYSTDVATLFLDPQFNIRLFTPATKALFHIIPADVGRPLADLSFLARDPTLLSDAAAVLARLTPMEIEVEPHPGSWFMRRILPYRTHDNGVEGVVITFTDITERKNIAKALEASKQEAEQANAAKSRFLAAASHDLRQPLQTLALLQALLFTNLSGEKEKKLVIRMDETLMVMTGMLNTLLDISQIEAGTVTPDLTIFPISDVLKRMYDEFIFLAEAQGLQLRVVPCQLYVRSDPQLLEQMIRNLLSNALKYTKTGKILLGCRRQGQNVVLKVCDSGIGIPSDKLQIIFEEYHQLENVARERRLGLGLGLSIVQRLGNLLGQKVNVASQSGKGSVFSIEIARATNPLGHQLSQLLPLSSSLPPPAVRRTRVGTILVVEDDPDVQSLLRQLLSAAGHTVISASDGPMARELASRSDISLDVVLSDFNLPGGMDGLQVIAALREIQGHTVPAMIVTGEIGAEIFRQIGIHHCEHLTKPVNPQRLLHTIQDMLAVPPTPTPSKAIIYVVDDHDNARAILRLVLESEGFVVQDFASCEAFLSSAQPTGADCLLLDASFPGMSGLSLMKRLTEAGSLLPIIMITGRGDIPLAVEAMKAGAADFIEKPASRMELLSSLYKTLERAQDSEKQMAWHHEAAGHLATLTTRQFEVMERILAGHPSKNIAADLNISQRTVENHRAAIMRKTGAKSMPALARLALAAGLTGSGDE